jgi:hypothetical protein
MKGSLDICNNLLLIGPFVPWGKKKKGPPKAQDVEEKRGNRKKNNPDQPIVTPPQSFSLPDCFLLGAARESSLPYAASHFSPADLNASCWRSPILWWPACTGKVFPWFWMNLVAVAATALAIYLVRAGVTKESMRRREIEVLHPFRHCIILVMLFTGGITLD